MILDLHENDWHLWEALAVPAEHWAVTASTWGSDWMEIHIDPVYAQRPEISRIARGWDMRSEYGG